MGYMGDFRLSSIWFFFLFFFCTLLCQPQQHALIFTNFPRTCQGESKISVVMTLSGSNAQRPLLRGLGVSECDTSGVKVGIGEGGAVCVQVCVWDGGKGMGGDGGVLQGQIVHGAYPSWMKLLPGPCPSVTVAAAVTKVLPWQGGHKKAWRGNGSRGQEWGSGGSRVTASWTAHKRRPGWEKKEGKFGFSFLVHQVDTSGC